jgi:hypothetical protein
MSLAAETLAKPRQAAQEWVMAPSEHWAALPLRQEVLVGGMTEASTSAFLRKLLASQGNAKT